VAGAYLALTTGREGDWTTFDDSIECGSPLTSLLRIPSFVMVFAAPVVVVVGLVRAIRSRSWASLTVSVAGLCLFACGAACGYLAVQVYYAGYCD
jgi:hypothetical protein